MYSNFSLIHFVGNFQQSHTDLLANLQNSAISISEFSKQKQTLVIVMLHNTCPVHFKFVNNVDLCRI